MRPKRNQKSKARRVRIAGFLAGTFAPVIRCAANRGRGGRLEAATRNAKPFGRKFWLGVLLVVVSGTSLLAHNSPNSAVMLDFQRDGVAAELILPLVELELGFKQELVGSRTQILAQHGPALKEYLLAHLNPVAPDGRRWSVEIRRLELQFKEQPFDLVARVWMRPPPGAPLRKFTFDYSVITHEVMNHAAFISVRRDWNTAVFPDRPEPAGMIQFTIMQVEIDRTHGSWWRGFGSVLKAKAGRFPWVSAALAALTLAAVGWQWMVVARIRRQAAPPQTTSASFPLRTQNHPAP